MDTLVLLTLCSAVFSNSVDGCFTPLGMKSGDIQDRQITSSSSATAGGKYHGPTYARLDRPRGDGSSTGSWSAAFKNCLQWIQADLGTMKYVSGIVLQGRQGIDQWVTEYKVQYSSDGVKWRYVQDSDRISDMVSSRNDKFEL